MATIRKEIMLTLQPFSSTAVGVTDYKATLDTTEYSNATYYFEVFNQNGGSNAVNIALRRDGTTTNDAVINQTIAASSSVRVAFTPPAGATVYIPFLTSTALPIQGIKIVIIQTTAGTSFANTETQYDLGGLNTVTNTTATDITAPMYFKYDPANYNGTITAYFEASLKSSGASTTMYAQLYYSTSLSGPWSASSSVFRTGTTTQLVRVSTTLLSNYYYKVMIFSTSTMNIGTLYSAKLIIQQSGTVTKTHATYLVSRAATGFVNLQGNTWNPSDWSGTSDLYYHTVDAISTGSTGNYYIQHPSTGNITGSLVSNPAYQVSSPAFTMPSSTFIMYGYWNVSSSTFFSSRLYVKAVVTSTTPLTTPFFNYLDVYPDYAFGYIDVGWNYVTNADTYILDRSDVPDFSTFTQLYSGSGNYYTDDDATLVVGNTYYYRIKAVGLGYPNSNYDIIGVPYEIIFDPYTNFLTFMR